MKDKWQSVFFFLVKSWRWSRVTSLVAHGAVSVVVFFYAKHFLRKTLRSCSSVLFDFSLGNVGPTPSWPALCPTEAHKADALSKRKERERVVLSVADDMHGCGACDPRTTFFLTSREYFFSIPVQFFGCRSIVRPQRIHTHVFSKVTFCSFLLVRNLRVTSCHSLGDQVVDDVEKYFSILPLRRWRVTRDREEEKKKGISIAWEWSHCRKETIDGQVKLLPPR